MKPERVSRFVNGKLYLTEKSILIAGDDYWDGKSYERHGRNGFLYVTPEGEYFVVAQSLWKGDEEKLSPISKDTAIRLYENLLLEHRVSYHDAFSSEKQSSLSN